MSIRYLKDHLLAMVQDRVNDIKETDIQWVLTVPAIWNDAAKQFMREAAIDVSVLL
jgi:molecular chaperone DnaK (HSP70)